MAGRSRVSQPAHDPNKSDSDDETYGKPSSGKKRKAKVSSSGGKGPHRKRARIRGDNTSDSENVEEEDDIEVSSVESDSEEEEPGVVELTPAGRPARGAAKRVTKYDDGPESGDDNSGIKEEVESRKDQRKMKPQGRKQALGGRPSLVIKLKVNPSAALAPQTLASPVLATRSTRSRTGSRAVAASPSVPQRRSSRKLSFDEQAPLVALTDSGRHTQIVHLGSAPPEPSQIHPRFAGKGLGLRTASTIIEASQEDSGPSKVENPKEIEESQDHEDAEGEEEEQQNEIQSEVDAEMGEAAVVAESIHAENDNNDDEDDKEPVVSRRRSTRSRRQSIPEQTSLRGTRRLRGLEESSDFDPSREDDPAEEEDDPSSNDSRSQQKASQHSEASSVRRSRRRQQKKRSLVETEGSDDELDAAEVAEEAVELRTSRRPRRRVQQILYDDHKKLRSRGSRPDYRVFRPELVTHADDDDAPAEASTPLRRARAGAISRSLFSTRGPFGGAGGPVPIFGGPDGTGAAGGADSDSSDDEMARRQSRAIGGAVGMTPTSGAAPHGLFPTFNPDTAQGASGGPANFGKVRDKKALADADPLGVDPNVTFEGVGGLDNHINQLKEMVALPLLYPEVFQLKHITPPRGVLFHGPPGTGKTLLARALASSVSSQGRKVTFYMRKGADALSKWVGEAERQLRLLFEEARKNQPSIIFFDEIDGLAPVRSSKQEQIHASIVATLLALMDGMDGRGQVIVIGATNRPDSVDPALRRPGRFDREFYFPLPNQEARRTIIDINTKGWEPPLVAEFKDQLAALTQGYGGADLRALCTEAALNAIQGTYPQIYKSNDKLVIDPTKIKVLAKDFMISVKKMIPSSERSAPSGATPLDRTVEPLLRETLADISKLLDEVLPDKKRLTALEEAEYDDRDDENGFRREMMQQNFERARIHRPRLLIYGGQGMGQHYLGGAILNRFERLHVQSFDISILFGDATRSAEAAVVQLFNEVRRHKPSVIYIPNINTWYETVGPSVIKLFSSLVRSLPPNDPIMVLGVMELDSKDKGPNADMMRALFGYSQKDKFELKRPGESARREFFTKVISLIETPPIDFPDSGNRKKRVLARLPLAPPPKAPEGPTREELKALKKQDIYVMNMLKIRIQPIMDEIKKKHKRFRSPILDESLIGYLLDEQNPEMLTTDLRQEQAQEMFRPYELHKDKHGVSGIREVATGKFYYNLETTTIELRLSNGYYKRPRDFLDDIKRLAKDAKTSEDQDRTLKANEIAANVEVDLQVFVDPAFTQVCEEVYIREQLREQQRKERGRQGEPGLQEVPRTKSNIPPQTSGTTTDSSGPIRLGVQVPGRAGLPLSYPQQHSGRASMSNGDLSGSDKHLSNGSFVEPLDEDVNMLNSQDDSGHQAAAAEMSPPNTQTQLSQKSALTPMARNSQPADYHNSASTTTSGQKTTDKSNPSTGPSVPESTNGVRRAGGRAGEYPNFSSFPGLPGGSQLPETQEMLYQSSASQIVDRPSSQPPVDQPSSQVVDQPSSQASAPSQSSPPVPMGPPPPSTRPSIPSLLNKPEDLPPPPPPPPPRQITLDPAQITTLHNRLVETTSGCNIEQLEQLNAALMAKVWETRGEWNRNQVAADVTLVFNDTIEDIELTQKIMPPSQEERLEVEERMEEVEE